jgi:hypothetical protein
VGRTGLNVSFMSDSYIDNLHTNIEIVWFVSLAVKTKLWLNWKANPVVGGTDRQSLLEFYDTFPESKYERIKPSAFKLRPWRESHKQKHRRAVVHEEFGDLEEQMDDTPSTDELDV